MDLKPIPKESQVTVRCTSCGNVIECSDEVWELEKTVVCPICITVNWSTQQQIYIIYHEQQEVYRGTFTEIHRWLDSCSLSDPHGSQMPNRMYKRKILVMYLPHVNYNRISKKLKDLLHREISFSRRVRLNKELNDMTGAHK